LTPIWETGGASYNSPQFPEWGEQDRTGGSNVRGRTKWEEPHKVVRNQGTSPDTASWGGVSTTEKEGERKDTYGQTAGTGIRRERGCLLIDSRRGDIVSGERDGQKPYVGNSDILSGRNAEGVVKGESFHGEGCRRGGRGGTLYGGKEVPYGRQKGLRDSLGDMRVKKKRGGQE